MTPRKRPTRRELLASVGAGGALYAGTRLGRAALGLEPEPFDHRIRTGGPVPLRIDWRETYSGTPVAGDTGAGDENRRSGPVLSLENVHPGDEGTVTLRVTREDGERTETGAAARVLLEFFAKSSAENGLTEPERTAGDATAVEGELQDHVDIAVWADVGAVGTGVGACNGRRDPGEPLLAAGTLAEVAGRTESVPLAGPGSDRDCLDTGASLCVGLRWSLDETVGNVVQGDSSTFGLGFAATGCGDAESRR